MHTSIHHRRFPLLLPAALIALAVAAWGCRQQASETRAGQGEAVSASDRAPYYHGLIVEYRSNLDEDPHNLAAMIGLANALADSGQCRAAIAYYERALKLNPHNANVVTDLGICYRNLGMTDRALETLDRALKVEPTHAKALFNLGLVYGINRKEYGKAITAWEQLLRTSPNHPKAGYVREHLQVFRKERRSHGR